MLDLSQSAGQQQQGQTCQQLKLVPPGFGVVDAHALDAAVRRSRGTEEVMQRLCHLGAACAASAQQLGS